MTKNDIIKQTLKLIRKINRIPTINDFIEIEISTRAIKYHFGNQSNLLKACKEKETTAFDGFIDQDFFTKESFTALEERIANHNSFVVSTAVTGCRPHTKFLKAIDVFNEANKGCLLVSPCSDPAKKGSNRWTLNAKIPSESVVFSDLFLNSNLMISKIKISAKQLNPLTGAGRTKGKPKSTIVGSPKQFLEYKAVKNDPNEIPRALMSTGSVTLPDYDTDRYMSERLSYFADVDHVNGALIVELDEELGSEKFFHFRQIQTDLTGSFIDLGKKYSPNGTIKPAKTLYFELGDYHCEEVDQIAKNGWLEIIKELQPELVGIQDFLTFNAINHHEEHQRITKAQRAGKNELNLKVLAELGRKEISDLLANGTHKILYKFGNHEKFLERYLQECRYKDDPINHRIALELAIEVFEGRNPIKKLLNLPKELEDRVIWLTEDSSYMVQHIEVGAHGHIGVHGTRNPGLIQLESIYSHSITGHSHTPGIYRGAFRVGTTSKLKMGYNIGPSGWCHTSCLVYENGSRQLINVINGKFRAQKRGKK